MIPPLPPLARLIVVVVAVTVVLVVVATKLFSVMPVTIGLVVLGVET